jgi:thiazole synthase ThiGH ThiG subunit
MPSADPPAVTVAPVRRTVKDQAEDQQEFIDNMKSQAYKSWPNEAGVGNTHIISCLHVLS